jgi:hypothetical protein
MASRPTSKEIIFPCRKIVFPKNDDYFYTFFSNIEITTILKVKN